MKRFLLGAITLLIASSSISISLPRTASAAPGRASFSCTPHFTGGHYGNRCPPQRMHPDQKAYPGHSYHTMRITLTVRDPSGIDDKVFRETMYCDCGRSTTKCTIRVNYTEPTDRDGYWVKGPIDSSAGGGNDSSSNVDFIYQLRELPPYELTPGISKDRNTVAPGGVITWTHSATRTTNGKPIENIRAESGTQRKGPMTSNNAIDDTKTRLYANKNNVQNSGLSQQILVEGGIRERVCRIGNSIGCRDEVRNPWPYRDISGNVFLENSTRTTQSFTSSLTVGKDTPSGTEFCRQTIIDKARYNGKTTYSSASSGFECVTVRVDETTKYSLTPKMELPSSKVYEPGSTIPLKPTVTNGGPAQSRQTEWEVTRIMLPPGVSMGAKENGADSTEAACGTYLRPAAATGGNCSTVARGSKVFSRINIADEVQALTAQIDDVPIGTRFCFALSIKPPTGESSSDATWRHSKLECVKSGKRPKVQIHGGDLMVGRVFNGSVSPVPTLASIVNTSNALREGRTYGSWTEYAISAPGSITNTGSASGLANGNTNPGQTSWSKLTFANTPSFGEFGSSGGAIPDVVSAVKSLYNVGTAPRVNGAVTLSSGTGKIQVASGNITLNSTNTFGARGQTSVIYAPNHTVTIAGNIAYAEGVMSSIRDIPQLIIIANNINVGANVERIDGWLVAQGSGGVINTCDGAERLSANVCDRQLTVNGPVAAKQLTLRRTAGSTTGDAAARSAPAEVFNLRADAYLWAQGIDNDSRRVITTYTSELPPRF